MNSTANHTYKDDDCYPDDILPKHFFIVLQLLIMLIGIPANIFSLFVSCHHIKQKNELGIYLLNLALSDICFIASLPIWIIYTIKGSWIHTSTMCTVCVFLLFTNFYTSAWLLSCIAVDRYLGVVYPLRFTFFRKPSSALVVSAAAWLLVIIMNSFIISPKSIYDEDAMVCLDVYPLRKRNINVARFVLGFFLPAVVVVFCYWRICKEVQSNKATSCLERKRLFRLLGSVLLSLTLCFGPLHVALLLRAVLEDCKPPTWLFLLIQIGKALSKLNCLADPFLYCFITRTGRSSIIQAIMMLKRKEEGATMTQ
ncbi:psychosine receptor-like [Trichomycterus rosablanca]|uniref:psychosine receptor-like n=1 Tax=Trichomycterus rosablanca TaxID=2290929 RepID=UPI002F355D47